METLLIKTDHPDCIPTALRYIRAGHLVAIPTDTVYGLAADLFNPDAIEKIYQVKEREHLKAIPVLLSSPAALEQVTLNMNRLARKLADRFWPGPLTLVVSAHPGLPENLSPQPTVGVRMPNHPDALALLAAGGPLAVTSANLSGYENTLTASQVYTQLAGRIPLILDGGKTPGGAPSTVVDCTGPVPAILRPGPISLEDILAALK
jgi:L-threonylcarbamoyladenylate synthase